METALRPGSAIGRVLAFGGHGFTSRPADRAVCELILRLATARAGGRPRICILPAAGEEASEQIGGFYSAFGERACDSSDLSLFRFGHRPAELRDRLLKQDLIYVGGGSLPDLLALWDAHELSAVLDLAWRQGVVLAGQGAGATCWFEAGIGESTGEPLPGAGLGLLGGSLCIHYNDEPDRRAAYLDAVADGIPGGYGIDDHAALIWEGPGPPSAVTAQRGARAYRVVKGDNGSVIEAPLPARFLPAPPPAALREDIAEFRRVRRIQQGAGWLGG
jgi:dipeptidase E